MSQGYIGVDLDGTLAEYVSTPADQWDPMKIGAPIRPMVERVKRWIAQGREVRIITARVAPDIEVNPTVVALDKVRRVRAAVVAWLLANGLPALTVQCHKCYRMVELWDDLAIRVVKNQGLIDTQAAIRLRDQLE